MIVLALDTTAPGGSCALARDGVISAERRGDESRPQAARLPGELMTLLQEEGIALDDVDAFAVAVGPGSFTGLRVGIATMQALAFVARKPLLGISALDALAAIGAPAAEALTQPGLPVRVATWVDAWRGEVYAALYERRIEIEPPIVAPPDALLSRLRGRPPLFIGDGAGRHAGTITAALGAAAAIASPAAPLLAGTIAIMAAALVRDGHRPPPDAIRPLYVRRSDAELARDARLER